MATRGSKKDRPKEAKVNTVIEEVDPKPRSLAPTPAPAEEKKPEETAKPVARVELGSKASLIPLKVFCLHKTGGKWDQAVGFHSFALRRKWGRKTWAEWNEAWDAFQKREVR
jgi:hypothetical protein